MKNPNFEPEQIKPLSEETKQQMKKIGYVIGGFALAVVAFVMDRKKGKKVVENPEDTNFEIVP